MKKTSYLKIIALTVITFSISSCSETKIASRTIADNKSFQGIIVADEPQAALIGREILSRGGSAGDAMTAMGLAMSVTLPSRVGLDGSGFCQVYDPEKKNVQTLDFMTNSINEQTVLPALPRAMFALYAKTGKLYWQELVSPAENIAKFDMNVSRAFAKDLEKLYAQKEKTKNIDVIRLLDFYSSKDKQPLKEGMPFSQLDLASVLSNLRSLGVGDFYNGTLAKRYLERVFDFYKDITPQNLSLYTPRWLASESIDINNNKIYLPSTKLGGNFGIKTWNNLINGNKQERQTALQDLSHTQETNADDVYAASAVAVDNDGMTVSCVFSMGKLFGDKKMLTTLGFVKSSNASKLLSEDFKQTKAGSMIMINENVNEFKMTSSTTGDSALVDMMNITNNTLDQKETLKTSFQKTITNNNKNSIVNAIYCRDGLPPFPDSCETFNDPRGYGFFRYSGVPKNKKRPKNSSRTNK